MKILLAFIFSTLTQYFVLCRPAIETSLKLVQIIYRHGDRTSYNILPINPNNAGAWWNKYGGLAQLTPQGMKQAREYGQYLKKRYHNFLNATYNRANVLARSTDYDRTLQSSYSILSGLYPPGQSFQRFDQKINWQPIPVHTTSKASDTLFNTASCALYNKLQDDQYQTAAYLEVEAANKNDLEYIGSQLGMSYTIKGGWAAYDPIWCEKHNGISNAPWVTDEWYQKLLEINDLEFTFDFATNQMASLKAGGILADWRTNFNNAVSGSSSTQLFLYGGHDSHIYPLLMLLNLDVKLSQPLYLSSIIVELRQAVSNSSDYYVQVYYKNNDYLDNTQSIEPKLMTIKGCGELCPLSQFMSITQGGVASFPNACNL